MSKNVSGCNNEQKYTQKVQKASAQNPKVKGKGIFDFFISKSRNLSKSFSDKLSKTIDK